ncbi:MAG TPA: GNAT family N-acetyltransferase [Planctomycetes bacterium]|nr:GNAT family N-acetyltransferase [Planctomycetota bacterium]
MASYEIRPYRPGDEHAILETFNAVFGEGKEDFEPRTLEEWRWGFERNPAGNRIFVAMQGDVCAAQCAALPFRVTFRGKPATITQGVDAMVHPEHRRGLRRPGLYVATARPFFATFRGPGRDVLHYGWPVEPAWRIGKTFLNYEIVRTQTVLFAKPPEADQRMPDRVEEIARFDDDVTALYGRCAKDWGLSVVRDPAYLNWRFFDHPRFCYRVLGLRHPSGELRAYAIFRCADFPHPNCGLVIDWLVEPNDIEAGELLHEALRVQARRDGAESMLAVFPDWSPWFDRFQIWSWDVFGSDYLLIGIIQDPHYDTWWLRKHWWYQLAELDTV